MEFIANILSNIGESLAETSSQGCFLMMMDEPECPESLIK